MPLPSAAAPGLSAVLQYCRNSYEILVQGNEFQYKSEILAAETHSCLEPERLRRRPPTTTVTTVRFTVHDTTSAQKAHNFNTKSASPSSGTRTPV